jgi:hypothetical protein
LSSNNELSNEDIQKMSSQFQQLQVDSKQVVHGRNLPRK